MAQGTPCPAGLLANTMGKWASSGENDMAGSACTLHGHNLIYRSYLPLMSRNGNEVRLGLIKKA